MADISKIKLNGTSYDIKDEVAREGLTTNVSVTNTGLITFKNSSNTNLYTLQLPVFDEEEIDDLDGSSYIKPITGIPASDLEEGILPNVITITLSTSWIYNNNQYNQSVIIPEIGDNITNKKIDLISTPSIIAQLVNDGVSQLYINNNNGAFTAIAIGGAPSTSLTIQATVNEVIEYAS